MVPFSHWAICTAFATTASRYPPGLPDRSLSVNMYFSLHIGQSAVPLLQQLQQHIPSGKSLHYLTTNGVVFLQICRSSLFVLSNQGQSAYILNLCRINYTCTPPTPLPPPTLSLSLLRQRLLSGSLLMSLIGLFQHIHCSLLIPSVLF